MWLSTFVYTYCSHISVCSQSHMEIRAGTNPERGGNAPEDDNSQISLGE